MEPPVLPPRTQARRLKERRWRWVPVWFACCLAAGVWQGLRLTSQMPVPAPKREPQAQSAAPPPKPAPAAAPAPVEEEIRHTDRLIPPIALNLDAPLITTDSPTGEAPLWDQRLADGGGLALRQLGQPGPGSLRLQVRPAQAAWRAELLADGLPIATLSGAQPEWAGTVPMGAELTLKVESESGGSAPTLAWALTPDDSVTALQTQVGNLGKPLPKLFVAPLDKPSYTFGKPLWSLGDGEGYALETAQVDATGTYLLTATGAEKGWALELTALGPDGQVTDTLGVLTPEHPVTSVHLDASELILLKFHATGAWNISDLTLNAEGVTP